MKYPLYLNEKKSSEDLEVDMDIEQTVAGITNTSDLVDTINSLEASSTSTNNEGPSSDIVDDTGKNYFVELIITLLASKPHIFESKVYESISSHHERCTEAPAQGYITPNNLRSLSLSSNSRTTWLKYEMVLCHLIKKKQLTSKILAEEILSTIKVDIETDILASVSSVLSACVKKCQQVNPNDTNDEDQEKWCEILDWLAWFCSSNDGEL